MKNQSFLIASMALALGALAADSAASSEVASQHQPNIILIMADDMGYECVGSYGCLSYRTPVIDKLAAEGIRFNHCYSQPSCTPSRVKLMTGRYGFRNYIGFMAMPVEEKTFGNQLKEAGYQTCMVGKWQLGDDWEKPIKFGFDDYCLMNRITPKDPFDRLTRGRGRYWGYPVVNANGKLHESEETFGPDIINEYAVNFIKKEKDKPFFLYYSMIAPHSPWAPSPLSKDGVREPETSEVRFFKDMIEYIDVLVGNVVRAVEETGQRENTLIIFTGDNGTGGPVKITAPSVDMRRMSRAKGEKEAKIVDAGIDLGLLPENRRKGTEIYPREGPLTLTDHGEVPGGKGKMTNGGTHVPLVINWPRYERAYKKHDNVCDDLIDFSDFFSTLIELGGGKLPTDREIDSVSFASRITDRGASQRDYVFCHNWKLWENPEGARDAIHDGNWRLYNNGEFYNLKKDVFEQTPLRDDQLDAEGAAAKARLVKAYTRLRGRPIPCEAISDKVPPPFEKKKKKKK